MHDKAPHDLFTPPAHLRGDISKMEWPKKQERRQWERWAAAGRRKLGEDVDSFRDRLEQLVALEPWQSIGSGVEKTSFTTPGGASLVVYRSSCVHGVSSEFMVEFLSNPVNWPIVDPSVDTVARSDTNPRVFRIRTKRIGLIHPRSTDVIFSAVTSGDTSFVGFQGCDASSDFGKSADIRARVWADGFRVQKINRDRCRTLYITATDPNMPFPLPSRIAAWIFGAKSQRLRDATNAGWNIKGRNGRRPENE